MAAELKPCLPVRRDRVVRERGVLRAADPVARLRLHALKPALRQELEDRPQARGRREGHARPALRHQARGRCRVSDSYQLPDLPIPPKLTLRLLALRSVMIVVYEGLTYMLPHKLLVRTSIPLRVRVLRDELRAELLKALHGLSQTPRPKHFTAPNRDDVFVIHRLEKQFCRNEHKLHRPTSSISAADVVSSAFAILTIFIRLMFRSPRSTPPTYVLCKPHTSANCSWLQPFDCRASRTRAPNRRNALSFTLW